MIRSALVLALGLGAAVAADTYKVDDTHAHAIYKVSHLGVAPSYGMFEKISGTISLDADPAKNSVSISIAADSLRSGVAKRDQHLAGPDFFDVKQFPTLTFASTAWKQIDAATAEVSGTLTIKGIAKPVTIKVVKTGEGKDPWGGFRVGYETTFAIDRNDFGITYGKGALGDTVTVMVALEGVKQ